MSTILYNHRMYYLIIFLNSMLLTFYFLYVVHLYSKRDRLSRFDRILQATVITVTLTYDKTLFESIDL